MKKIVIAIAMLATAMSLNAASVTWSLTSITTPEATTALTAGTAAYFMDASTYDAFVALAVSDMAAYAKANNTYSTTTSSYKGATRINQASGSYSAKDAISGYIVLFDSADAATATYVAYTAVDSTSIPESGANAALGFGTFAAAMAKEGSSGGWQTTAVPEPTSGLLMLLGMAGLALRRRT